MRSLTEVGKTKSLGYLGKDFLEIVCDLKIKDVVAYAEEKSLKYIVYGREKELKVDQCVFLFDEKMLLNILEREKEVLIKAGIPYDNSYDYVNYIAYNYVHKEEQPKAHRVIGLTFNDEEYREN